MPLQGIRDIKINSTAKGILILLSISNVYFCFAWMPGDSGICSSTVAEQAAKEATLLLPIPNLLVLMNYFKTAVQLKVKDSEYISGKISHLPTNCGTLSQMCIRDR